MTFSSIPPLSASTILLVGPGWLGAAAVRHLRAEGAVVFTMSRSAPGPTSDTTDQAFHIRGDIATAATDPTVRAVLPPTIDHMVICVAPSRPAGDSYAMYPHAAAGAAALAQAVGIQSVLYTSSTGVYAVDDGREVTEATPIVPTTARVAALAEAEQQLLALNGRAVQILRVAGLYGPDRDPAARFAVTDPRADHWCNMAWRDDVVRAVAHLLGRASAGDHHVFNCADGVPLLASTITHALGGLVHETGPAPAVTGRSNQRVSVAALRATGWAPQIPTVVAGLRRLGHLVIDPVLS